MSHLRRESPSRPISYTVRPMHASSHAYSGKPCRESRLAWMMLQRQSSKSVVSERYYRLQVRLFETLVKLNTDGGISTRRMWSAARRKRRHGSKFACCIPAVCLAETFRLHPVRYQILDPKQFAHYLHSPIAHGEAGTFRRRVGTPPEVRKFHCPGAYQQPSQAGYCTLLDAWRPC
jgi:hypothetical protein